MSKVVHKSIFILAFSVTLNLFIPPLAHAIDGIATGIEPTYRYRCVNMSTGQVVTGAASSDASFNCDALGLTSNPGDLVTIITTPVESYLARDAVFANSGEPNQVCLEHGRGSFTCSDVSPDSNFTNDAAVADLNGDNYDDIVFANGEIVSGVIDRVCLSDGTGGFTCSDLSADVIQSEDVALGDFNSDFNLDVIIANGFGMNRICFGDGTGSFADCSDIADVDKLSYAVALGDINEDGLLDAVFADYVSFNVDYNTVCLGDGAGGFSCYDMIDGFETFSKDVELADMNGDGTLDAVFANDFVTRDRLCLNDGAGNFTCSDAHPGASSDYTEDLAIGDIDNDGDNDLVSVERLSDFSNLACMNDGAGNLNCNTFATNSISTQGVDLADMNGDGILDTVIAMAGNEDINQLCIGDGAGGFSCSDISPDLADSSDVETGNIGIKLGASVNGLSAPFRIRCINQTTGTRVNATSDNNGAFDCRNAGLEYSPGDQIRFAIAGDRQ